jgi:hypothetical protein
MILEESAVKYLFMLLVPMVVCLVVYSASNRNEYKECLLGVKAADS